MVHNILIVDDDPVQHTLLSTIIKERLGYKATYISGGKKAIDYLMSEKGNNISLMILDLIMPYVGGAEVIEAVRPIRPDLGIITISSQEDLALAAKTVKSGADDFILKNESPERIITSIENTLEKHRLSYEVSRLERCAKGQVTFSDIIGTTSKVMQDVVALAKKAASSDIAVMIKGESGVGKELFARAIHGCSKRAGKPFIAVNCGAIPETLVESTLFGHEKGSFTGAIYSTLGKFREADGGTLFLDEVGELRTDIQSKLLRALQNGEIEPVGGGKPVHVNVRVISATNRNLDKDMANGSFRQDLFYRLNVFPITIPPLRERGPDIDILIDHFFDKIVAVENSRLHGIDDSARELLKVYSWPGNIRQLENTIFRAIVLGEDGVLHRRDFAQLESATNARTGGVASLSHGGNGYATSVSLLNEANNFKDMHSIESEVIRAALEFYHWKISEVARRIGLGRSTLYRKMHELGIHHYHPELEEMKEKVA